MPARKEECRELKKRFMANAYSAMLSIVARTATSRSTGPRIGAVLFEVQQDGRVMISATDGDMAVSLTASVPAGVRAEVDKSMPAGGVALHGSSR